MGIAWERLVVDEEKIFSALIFLRERGSLCNFCFSGQALSSLFIRVPDGI
jgi:hypothetical protein